MDDTNTASGPNPTAARMYSPGLDAMRGLIVAIGMFFHAHAPLFQSGFFFVDVFGIISGYLITRILLTEREYTGGVSLVRFYIRRARRLLPALFAVLTLVPIYAFFAHPEILHDLRVQTLYALGYVYNWYAIFFGSNYFYSYSIMPIQHLWTLAIEEQFYIVWPAALGLLFAWSKHLRRFLPYVLVVLALCTAVISYLVYFGGPDGVDPMNATVEVFGLEANRLLLTYMSTVTRAGGFLLGAALAFWWRPERIIGATPRLDRALNIGGLTALGLILVFTNLQFFTDDLHGLAARWGTVAVWVMCIVLMMAATWPRATTLQKILTRQPLLKLGELSYGLYLIHWPVYQFIRLYSFKSIPVWQLALLLPILVGITQLSLTYFERPIRKIGFTGWLRAMRVPVRIAVVTVMVGLVSFSTFALATAQRPNQTDLAVDVTAGQGNVIDSTTIGISPRLVIGDSIALSNTNSFVAAGYRIDASTMRTYNEGAQIVRYLMSDSLVSDTLIMHLGSNDIITKESLREMLDSTRGLRRVVLVTLFRENWEPLAANNDAIRAMASEFDNVTVADWHALASANPEYVSVDGIHASSQGKTPYVDLLLGAAEAPAGTVLSAP